MAHNFLVVSAVMDDDILANCLARSPDIRDGSLPLVILRDQDQAGVAYNSALRKQDAGTIIIFAHQDVYLPAGFRDSLRERVLELEKEDPSWAALAAFGLTPEGELAGRVWSTAWHKVFAGEAALPARIQSADELLLIVKAGDTLMFDEHLPSFHLYGTDIILTGLQSGRASYAIDIPVVHHDKPVIGLTGGYAKAYRYMQRKWRKQLPVRTLIVPITRGRTTLMMKHLRIRWYRRGMRVRTVPTGSPAEIASAQGWE